MTIADIELITVKTREVIDAAIHTMEYSTTIIDQSKRLIRSINGPIVS